MIDFLIIGGGFSGIAFSWELEQHNISYKLADPAYLNSSTVISGGLINPVTGRRSSLQWNINTLIPLVKKKYLQIEEKLQNKLLYETSILKIHKSEAALEEWLLAKLNVEIQPYINESFDIKDYNRFLDFRFGAVNITPVLRIDTTALTNKYFEFIRSKHIKRSIDHSEITANEKGICYQNETYKYVVFCEGIGALQNPWFKNIPFKPAKGECMIIEIPNFSSAVIIHKGIILIPLGGNRYWAGATNTWNDLTTEKTDKGTQELESGLQQLLKVPYSISEHKTAIRPTIRDRAPVVGGHPEHKNMFILNGMGTKGASLSNFYAQKLLDHILTGVEIPKEANIKRFYDLLRK